MKDITGYHHLSPETLERIVKLERLEGMVRALLYRLDARGPDYTVHDSSCGGRDDYVDMDRVRELEDYLPEEED